ncbi:MAG: hypothetical protein Q8Q76_08905 [Methylotenera sp.]|nr:hypothetical protein [Methylotenera sp.]
MDKEAQNELGILHARIEYLQLVVSILLSKLPKDDFVNVGADIIEHFVKHQAAALNSTFPDSYLKECETYAPAQLSAASRLHDLLQDKVQYKK